MFLTEIKNSVVSFLDENSTMLLTAAGVVGTVGTAVLSGRATLKAAQVLRDEQNRIYENQTNSGDPDAPENPWDVKLDTMTKVVKAGPHFLPPVIAGSATIGCIIMSHRMSAQKIAGLAAAYGLVERNLSEHKAKVAEKLTGPKNAAVGEEISQDRVNRAGNPPNMAIIGDDVLCFDEATDRYFHSSMEKIRSAVNKINFQIHDEDYADASDFYHLLGMKGTKWSSEVGWNRDNPLELKYDTVTSPDGRPCLAIEFANFPRPDFIGKNY